MKVIWTRQARQDRLAIWDYVAARNPAAAFELDALFSEAASRLAEHPHIGKAGRVASTRELVPHENYCLVYEIYRDAVWVLTVIHTARQWPKV